MKIDMNEIKKLQKYSRGLSILYVEDNKEARDSTLDVLNEFFEDVVVAVDGKDGLDKYNSKKFDLIITDINMPNLDGISMLEKIREVDSDVPVLIVSAYNESGYFIETIRLQVEGYLLKPLELTQFVSMLAKTIEKIDLKKQNEQYRLKLEEKVQNQSQELTNKDKIIQERQKFASMGEMIDAIAHQFRQPLGIMRLRNQEMEYLVENELNIENNDIKESILSTQNQLNHLIGTIEEFRSFFREENDVESIYLSKICDSIRTLLKDELIKNTVCLELDLKEDIPISVIPNEFKHVLINLINNAIEAFNIENIKEQRVIKVKVKDTEENIFISIEDNAGGIPEHVIGHIFEPNFTTKDITGTGIGLYITKTILEKIGASIEVENIANGARFTITLLKGD